MLGSKFHINVALLSASIFFSSENHLAYADTWGQNAHNVSQEDLSKKEGCDPELAKVLNGVKQKNIQAQGQIAQSMFGFLKNASYTAASCIDNLIPNMSSSGLNLSSALAQASQQAMNKITSSACQFAQKAAQGTLNDINNTTNSIGSMSNGTLSKYTSLGNAGGLNLGTNLFQVTQSNGLGTSITGLYQRAAGTLGINPNGSTAQATEGIVKTIGAKAFNNEIGSLSNNMILKTAGKALIHGGNFGF